MKDLELLLKRRSFSKFSDSAPSCEEILKIIELASTVPDHGGLKPYRFVVISGERRALFGQAMVAVAEEVRPDFNAELAKKIEAKAFLAPLLIAIIFSPVENTKIPRWEQFAAAACTGYALNLGAFHLGYAAIWKSFGLGVGEPIRKLFKMTKSEELLGWVNIGKCQLDNLPERENLATPLPYEIL